MIYNSLNAHEREKKYQEFTEPSMTIPDQTMSIKELLTRYSRGLPLDGQKTPIWEGEEGFEKDFKTLDLAEQEELVEKARQELKDIEKRIRDAKNNELQDVTPIRTEEEKG